MAASFVAAVLEVLVAKCRRALAEQPSECLVIVGGVAASPQLRAAAAELCAEAGVRLSLPPLRWSTDNGAMIGLATWDYLAAGEDLAARPPPPCPSSRSRRPADAAWTPSASTDDQGGRLGARLRLRDPVERAEGLETAVDSIRRGELVVMPVDASYGLAADAFQPAAVDALAASKGRGRDLPIPVMVGSWSGLDGLTLIVQPEVRALVEAFWPGPLTLVVEHAPSLAWDLGDDRGAVSIRMPMHPVALELLARTGPLAVSGANLAGKRVPLTAQTRRSSSATRWRSTSTAACASTRRRPRSST